MSKLQKALDTLLNQARALDPHTRPEDEPKWDPSRLDRNELDELDHLFKRWLWEVAPEFCDQLRPWATRREMIGKSDANRRLYTDGRPGWASPPLAPITAPLTEEERLRLAFFLAESWVGDPVVLDTLGTTGMLTLMVLGPGERRWLERELKEGLRWSFSRKSPHHGPPGGLP